MRAIQTALFIGLTAATVSGVWSEGNEAIKKDMAQLQGEWTTVSGSADGQQMPVEMLKQMKRICKGDETTTTMAGQVFLKAKFTIDPSRKPKTIDYQMTDGFTKGKTQLGIYEVDGDAFRACFGKPGANGPRTFPANREMAAPCRCGSEVLIDDSGAVVPDSDASGHCAKQDAGCEFFGRFGRSPRVGPREATERRQARHRLESPEERTRLRVLMR